MRAALSRLLIFVVLVCQAPQQTFAQIATFCYFSPPEYPHISTYALKQTGTIEIKSSTTGRCDASSNDIDVAPQLILEKLVLNTIWNTYAVGAPYVKSILNQPQVWKRSEVVVVGPCTPGTYRARLEVTATGTLGDFTNVAPSLPVKIDCKPTQVSMVIDDTSSMLEEIGSVKAALTNYITSQPEDEYTNWNLTTFKDTPTNIGNTEDRSEILSWVSSLYPSGGGDCPEDALGGISTGIGALGTDPNTDKQLLIATDASAKDGNIDGIIASAQSNGIKVNVLLTGDCDALTRAAKINSGEVISSQIALKRIANETGGQYFYILGGTTADFTNALDKIFARIANPTPILQPSIFLPVLLREYVGVVPPTPTATLTPVASPTTMPTVTPVLPTSTPVSPTPIIQPTATNSPQNSGSVIISSSGTTKLTLTGNITSVLIQAWGAGGGGGNGGDGYFGGGGGGSGGQGTGTDDDGGGGGGAGGSSFGDVTLSGNGRLPGNEAQSTHSGYGGGVNGNGASGKVIVSWGSAAIVTNTSSILIQSIAVPSYFYPGVYWTQLENNPSSVGLAVINPNSGVGASIDSNYVNQVASTRSKGVGVVGYVFTNYGQRSVVDVKSEVDKYFQWYGVDGILFDQSSSDCSQLSYYQDVYTYVKSKNASARVVLNPGTNAGECYMAVSDIVINFDDAYTNYSSWQPSAWVINYPANRFWQLISDVGTADLQTVIALSKQHRAGWIYVTSDSSPNPWDTLPDANYWNTELSLVAN